MSKLKIINCSDSLMWYRDKVGQEVELLYKIGNWYMSREDSGLANIVLVKDAIVIKGSMSKEKEILKEVGESPQYRLFEFFLQEHGITLLEGQMHDIIHEVQLYLDATNDNPVVKENLTPEEVKELREALGEITEQIYKCPLDLSSDEKVEEATYLDATIEQAKQLLKED